jgi:hypothetical protein
MISCSRGSCKDFFLFAIPQPPCGWAKYLPCREFTQLSRSLVARLMGSPKHKGPVRLDGAHRGARWYWTGEHNL